MISLFNLISKLIDNKEDEDYLMEGTLWKVITDIEDDVLIGKEEINSDNLSKLFVYDSVDQIDNFKNELIYETIYSQQYNSKVNNVQIRLENTYSMEDIYSNQYVSLNKSDFKTYFDDKNYEDILTGIFGGVNDKIYYLVIE